MIREISIMRDSIRVGWHNGRIQKMICEKALLSTISHNMEITRNMTNKEMEEENILILHILINKGK